MTAGSGPNWAPDITKPGDKTPAEAEDAWDEVIPLGSRLVPPAFPLDCLPSWLADIVQAVAEETQTPPDIAAAFALGGLSTAAGGKAVVRVRGGWHEPLNLFLVCVAPPATRKSAVFRAMTAPLYQAEQQLVIAGRAKARQTELLRSQLQEADKQARTKAVRSGSANDLAEAESTALALEEAVVPPEVQLIAKNVTPEECSTILSEQNGRLSILSAEGDLFDIVCGRYSNGVPALSPFLEAHAGDVLKVNRRGRAEYVRSPALTIAVCIQPAVLAFLAQKPRLRGQGLLARFLYVLPKDTVGYRNSEPDLVPDQVRHTYEQNMQHLVLSLAEWERPQILALSAPATKLVIDFQNEIEPQLRAGVGELDSLRDWAGKLVGAAARIAGLLHLAEHPHDGFRKPIAEQTMHHAVEIARYFIAHAAACFGAMAEDRHTQLAREALAWITKNETVMKARQFSQRDLHRGMQTKLKDASTVTAVLSLLDAHGYIRALPQAARGSRGGRRPSPQYVVHPALFAKP
ncbi:YfjI family protein [Nonomuraea ferruginea]|uniref:YfjI family protein n=1 Tax=Nonomuraea ferruginea TaxID=46174 RepID=A0ABT4SZW9_9ACTN|nr:YfjI family protein [Nonomuraea ferruginea]MDA0642793.1 YfjI family protein [Nonomuraea ferruginea]